MRLHKYEFHVCHKTEDPATKEAHTALERMLWGPGVRCLLPLSYSLSQNFLLF